MGQESAGVQARAGRRGMLKAGLAAGAAAIGAPALTLAKGDDEDKILTPSPAPASPPTQAFVQALPVYLPKQPVARLTPAPTELAAGDECGRDAHQRFAQFALPNIRSFELFVKEAPHSFHPALPTQPIWGYDGIYPGPTIVGRYGVPNMVRIYNQLPQNHVGYGSPEITTHLHNLHCGSESDGFTGDYYSAVKFGPTLTKPGTFRDHLYPHIYAGIDTYGGIGDPREALGTLWYHDHRIDFTGPNVYKGLAGFYLLFDDIDSGDENDPNPQALRLPSGVGRYDIPLILHDKRFDSKGLLYFNQFEPDGVLGDRECVNGKIQPYFKVERRKYRFRILNGGPARVYELHLTNSSNVDQAFTYIANDGNLLPAPLIMAKATLGVAERADIVIDFAKFPLGTKLYLVNKLEQVNGRGPTGRTLNPGVQLMRFDVDSNPPTPDVSRVPSKLRELPPVNLSEVKQTRVFEFARDNGAWTVNGKLFDVRKAVAKPKKGTAEIWVLRGGGDWVHPVHIHFEEGRILSRDGQLPPPHERGRKDVFLLHKGEEIRVYLRFRDYVGKYIMHCHNLTHEDHAMMVRWDIVT